MTLATINAEDTWPIRHKVMWPNKPKSFVHLKNDVTGLHYGIFEADKLVSVISLFIDGDTAQFRKLATLHEHQRKGFASSLIKHCISIATNLKVKKLWCNARSTKVDYYAKLGFNLTENHFTKQSIVYTIMEYQL